MVSINLILAIIDIGVCVTTGLASFLYTVHRQHARTFYKQITRLRGENEHQLALFHRLQLATYHIPPEEAVYIPQHGQRQVVIDCYTTIQLDVPSHHEPFPPITNPLNLIDFSAHEKIGANVLASECVRTFAPSEIDYSWIWDLAPSSFSSFPPKSDLNT